MIRFRLALVLAFVTAFVALAYEIVWFRAYSFAARGGAPAFGLMLGFYLLGVALGSRWVQRQSRGEQKAGLFSLAALLLLATVMAFLVVPAMAWVVTFTSSFMALPVLTLAAGSMGATLPLLAHAAVAPDGRAGANVSYLYIANILGSASGSLLVGFVAMDYLSLSQICIVLTVLSLAVVAALASYARPGALRWCLPAFALSMCATVYVGPSAYAGVYHKMVYRGDYRNHAPLKLAVENRHGAIVVDADDRLYGGGAYDGVFNTSILDDRNMVVRAYVLGALMEPPRRVLMIGLATASWAQVIVNMPGVEHLTVVEINPGYEELVARYDAVKSILDNPKVEIVYDDGRRWLVRHPEEKFDAVVQNTTHHYRAHITNIVSTEYFGMVKKHLNPGAAVLVNTTGSEEIMRTVLELFPFGTRVFNTIVVSDQKVGFDGARFDRMLRTMRIDGHPVLDMNCDPATDACRKILERHRQLTHLPSEPGWPKPTDLAVEDRSTLLSRLRASGVSVITDDNMASEWKALKF